MTDSTNDALALLAHELRTPVSTIVAAATGLERGGDELPLEKQRALVELVASEAKRLARLVDAVVSAAKLDAGELPVDVQDADAGAVVAAAVAAAAAGAPADRSISQQMRGDLVARFDADRLRQVIDNLID
ncbi:MAG: sensor histidine kinase, partial [Gaiellaceae bacterium]